MQEMTWGQECSNVPWIEMGYCMLKMQKPSQKCKNIQYIIDIKVAVLVETFKKGRDLSVPEQHKNTDTMNKTD